MEQEATLGLAAVAAVLVGGILLYGWVIRAAYPMRVELFERAQAMLDRSDCTHQERIFINRVLDTALSFRAGWIVPRAMLRSVFKKVNGQSAPADPIVERTIGLMPRYFLSVLIANPVAFAFTALIFPILLVAACVREHEKPKDAFRDATREVGPRGLRAFAY